MRRLLARKPNGDRGAVLVFVAVGSVVLLAMGSLVIDLGMQRRARRALITATDSTSLNLAQQYADSPPVASGTYNCAAEATVIVEVSYGDVSSVTCTYYADSGVVEVDAVDSDQDALLSKLLGRDKLTSAATTSATVIPGLGDIRPLALCADAQVDHDKNALTPPVRLIDLVLADAATEPEEPREVLFTKESDEDCLLPASNPPTTDLCSIVPSGGASASGTETIERPTSGKFAGNWGFVDFTPGQGDTQDRKDWVLSGFSDYPIWVDDCLQAASGGALGALADNFDEIVGSVFALPIFDLGGSYAGPGGKKGYQVVGFAGVRLLSTQVKGKEADRFLELSILAWDPDGSCCDELAEKADVEFNVRICAVTGKDAC